MQAKELPTISTLKDLQGVARTLERETLHRYAHLAELMKYGHNTETAASFEALATRKLHFEAGEGDTAQSSGEFTGDADEPGAEIADTPYLMTPYQAFRLAVYNEEQAFDFFSRIASETEDVAIRDQAESLARNQLQYIAEFRLQRRRAFRAQTETAVGQVVRDRALKTPEDVYEIRRVVEVVILEVLEKECCHLKGKLPVGAASALRLLTQEIGAPDCRATMENMESATTDEIDPQATFLALRSILREIEAAFEVFMAVAETGPSEATVSAAQENEKKYIRQLALIRECLDDLVDA
ncbi:MAG: hypothetical protein ACTSV1_04030 [Alphaproteobacteria bacterium]